MDDALVDRGETTIYLWFRTIHVGDSHTKHETLPWQATSKYHTTEPYPAMCLYLTDATKLSYCFVRIQDPISTHAVYLLRSYWYYDSADPIRSTGVVDRLGTAAVGCPAQDTFCEDHPHVTKTQA
jgi:hypothetical protein